MKLQNSIEELIEEQKKKWEIAFALYWKWYNYLDEVEKEEVDKTFRLYKEEIQQIKIPSMNDILGEVEEMKKRKDENWGILGWKSWINFEDWWYSFDEIVSGWQPWKVYTIAWYSNVWKSNFTYRLLTKQLDKKIFFFSTEVNKGMVLQNLVKSYYGISFYEALDKIVNEKEKIMEDFKNVVIFDDIIEFEQIKKIVETEKPEIVVIDFIQWITAWNRDWYEKNSYLARAIQRLAIDNNVVLFSVAQITAWSVKEAKKDWVFTVKWAGEYFESSDVILHIFRPVKSEPNDLTLKIEKNKFWPLREFEIEAEFKTWQFKSI